MKTALITGKTNVPHLFSVFKSLQQELSNIGVESFVIENSESIPQDKSFDIVFSIGGDGSFVGAARKYIYFDVPIVAVKGGTVGFLANIDPADFKIELPKLFDTNAEWTKRMVLSGKTETSNTIVALNEFLFSSERKGQLTEFLICINDNKVIELRADGLLISTPTGSTAYNLSAGGPISLPDMELLTITPVCSHILGERPLVIGLNNKVQIINKFSANARVWADGQESIPFDSSEVFTITKPLCVKTLHTTTKDFFGSLSRKLGWSLRTSYNKS